MLVQQGVSDSENFLVVGTDPSSEGTTDGTHNSWLVVKQYAHVISD